MELNADLGEGEPAARTRALMAVIDSANIACGGHAGTVRSMAEAVSLAASRRVHIGAHPGLADRRNFGREARGLAPGELEGLLVHQVGGLEMICHRVEAKLHHIKLHGALYHLTEQERLLSAAYLDAVARWWPGTIVYALAGGRVARLAKARRMPVWQEGFLDRGYQENGQLVPRGEPGAITADASVVCRRLRRLFHDGQVETVSGRCITLRPDTVCLHGDTPRALNIARRVRAELTRLQSSFSTPCG